MLAAGAIVLLTFGPRSIENPGLFVALLVISSVASAFKVNLPLGDRRIDDVGVVRGRLRGAAAARRRRDDVRRRRQRVEPVHVPHREARAALPDAVQHGVAGADREGDRPGVHVARRAAPGEAFHTGDAFRGRWSARPPPTSSATPSSSRPRSACRRASRWCASGTRTFSGARRATSSARWPRPMGAVGHRAGGYWMALLAAAPLYLTYRTYKVYLGTHPGSAAARAAGVRPAPGDDRSARARHRREGSDRAEPHPPRPGLRRGPGARARDVGQRDPGRQDRGAAARHRQARRARAHPVEARAAHPGGVPEDPHPSRRSAPRSSAACRSPIRSRRSSSATTSAGTARAIRPA